MSADGKARFIRITADPAHADAAWWAASKAAKPDPGCAHKVAERGGTRACIVLPRHAANFRAWAASLPGWREGLFIFEEIDLAELLSSIGHVQEKPQNRLDTSPNVRSGGPIRECSARHRRPQASTANPVPALRAAGPTE